MAATHLTSPATLASAALPAFETRSERFARDLGLALAGSLVLLLAAKISVPFWPVPMTLQTLAVLAIGAALGPRVGLSAVALYVGYGLAGLPVFANTPPAMPGPAYLLGPTGGFILGFFVAAAIAGWAAARGASALRLAFGLLLADAALLLLGMVWLAWFAQLAGGATGTGLAAAFAKGVQPFLLGEAVKVALTAAVARAGWSWIARRH